MGWFLCLKNFTTRENCVRDLLKFPELRWLDRFDIIVPIAYAFLMLGLGKWLEIYFPELTYQCLANADMGLLCVFDCVDPLHAFCEFIGSYIWHETLSD